MTTLGRQEFLSRKQIAAQIDDATTVIGAAVRRVTPTGAGATGASLRLATMPYNVIARRRYVGSSYAQPIATDPDTGNIYTVNWGENQRPWLAIFDETTQAFRNVYDLSQIPGDPFGLLVDDSHDTMSIAVHEGVIHIAGNMHTVGMKYARTDATGNPATFTAASFGSDTGNFSSVTYPQFFIVGGQLFATWRNGNSGSGKMMLKRFSRGPLTWANATVLVDGDVTGEGPYPSKPLIHEDPETGIAKFGFFVTRRMDSIAGNNRGYTFIESADLGTTFHRADGAAQPMPLTANNWVDAYPVDHGSGFINQCGGTYDADGHPHGFMTLYDAGGNTQYYNNHWTGTAWALEQLTRFTSRVDMSSNTLFLSTARPDGFTAGGRVYLVGKTMYDGLNCRPLLIDATPGADHTPAKVADIDLAGWEPSAIDHVGISKFGRLNLFLCSVDQVANSKVGWNRQWAGLLSIRADALIDVIRGRMRLPRWQYVQPGGAASMPVTNVIPTSGDPATPVVGTAGDVSAKVPRTIVAASAAYPKGRVLAARTRARVTYETGTTSATLSLRATPSAGSQPAVDLNSVVLVSGIQGNFETPLEPLPLYVETDGTRRDTMLTPRLVADNAAGVRVEAYGVDIYELTT